jgi:hypothetical protein
MSHLRFTLQAVLGLALVLVVSPLQAQTPKVVFTDITAAAKISFRHTNGAFGKKYLPETMGSGVVIFDFDGDGAQDIFFVNSTKSEPSSSVGHLCVQKSSHL